MPSPELARVLDLVVRGAWNDPFRVLGPHMESLDTGETALVIRAMRPGVARAEVVPLDAAGGRETPVPMARVHPEGMFEAALPGRTLSTGYRLVFTWPDGHSVEADDPYRFGQVLGEVDMHLLGEGTHYRSWERLGSHMTTIDGVAGTYFAVWAPSAERVSVVGDFNGWDGRVHPMRLLVANGIWELFIPGLGRGSATSTRSACARPGSRSSRPIPTSATPSARLRPRRSSGTRPPTAGATATG